MIKIEIAGFYDKQYPGSICPLLTTALQGEGVVLCDEWCAWAVDDAARDPGCLLALITGWTLMDAAERYLEHNASEQEQPDANAES